MAYLYNVIDATPSPLLLRIYCCLEENRNESPFATALLNHRINYVHPAQSAFALSNKSQRRRRTNLSSILVGRRTCDPYPLPSVAQSASSSNHRNHFPVDAASSAQLQSASYIEAYEDLVINSCRSCALDGAERTTNPHVPCFSKPPLT